MSNTIRDNSAFLHLIMSPDTPKAQVTYILETVSKAQLMALTEIAYNLLKGNIKIDESHKSTLRKHAHKLRLLSKAKLPAKTRREVLESAFVINLVRAAASVLK